MADQLDYERMQRDLDIAKSKVFLRPDASFFGPVLCSLAFHWSEEVKTCASNSENFWWAPSDFLRCVEEAAGETESSIMHELWHVARLHDLRRGSRCPDIWNIACDVWINRELKKAGWYIHPAMVFMPQFDHIEAEEDIYDQLKAQGGGGGGGSASGNQSGNGSGSPCGCGHNAAPSQSTPQTQIAVVVKAIQSAKAAGQPGAIPGSMEQIVDKFLSPIIPWEQHLYQWMSDLQQEDFSWARPNRRYLEI